MNVWTLAYCVVVTVAGIWTAFDIALTGHVSELGRFVVLPLVFGSWLLEFWARFLGAER